MGNTATQPEVILQCLLLPASKIGNTFHTGLEKVVKSLFKAFEAPTLNTHRETADLA